VCVRVRLRVRVCLYMRNLPQNSLYTTNRRRLPLISCNTARHTLMQSILCYVREVCSVFV